MNPFTSQPPTAFPRRRSASAPVGTLHDRPCAPGERRGGDPAQASPLKPSVVQSVDELLAGAVFDPQAVFNSYWTGQWSPQDPRGSLFGPLKGPALYDAVVQVLQVGQASLRTQRHELKAFNNLFEPLLHEATADAEAATEQPEPPEPPPSGFPVQDTPGLTDAGTDAEPVVEACFPPWPARQAPLSDRQARHTVHLLLDHREGADLTDAWDSLGPLEGIDRLRALDQVELSLHELLDMLTISDADGHRIAALIEAMRQGVEVKEEDRLLAALLRGAHPGDREAPAPLDMGGLIDRLRKGKFGEGDNAALIELFGGRTGSELWDAINAVECALREGAHSGERTPLSEDEREAVLSCLTALRQGLLRESLSTAATLDGLIAEIERWPGPGEAPPTPVPPSVQREPDALGALGQLIHRVGALHGRQPRGLSKHPHWLGVRLEACRRVLQQGGVAALQRLLAHLSPPQQWQVLSTLVEDTALLKQYPALLALEDDVYRHRIAQRRGDQPLKRVRDWYRLLSTQARAWVVPPAVPAGIGAEEWVRELWILLYQRHPEPSRQRAELSQALERYQHALGVKTDREHAAALWLDSVRAALAASTSGHALLEVLRHHLGLDANVALALMAALAEPVAFDDTQRVLIRRAAAILMAEHDHSLLCIALPYHKARTPQRLNIFYPRAARPHASADTLDHHQKLLNRWREHAPLVDQDLHRVQAWLSDPPTTRTGPDGQAVELTPGEQCDHLLCAMALPPKRVELALLKIAQSRTDPDGRDKYLLVRRLLSELVYSERNDARRNPPMSASAILLRALGVAANGAREGGAHGVAMFAVRLGAHYMGGWSFPLLGGVCMVLSLWARYHLEHAKSPDYQLNPSPILDNLIRYVPVLNTVCLSGLLLCTGILPAANGLELPFDLGEALYLMNVMRALRQVMQSGTQPLARLFRLTDARGAGLPAQLTFFVNCGRDALYMGSSIGFLFFLGRHLDEQMAGWGAPRSTGDRLLRELMKTLPSTLNEMVDGFNPDIAILSARWVSWLKGTLGLGDDDFLLQPGVPLQPVAVPAHMADHIAGRSDIVGLQDPFNTASALATHLEQHGLALFFKWVAVVLNGFLGALRGRELSYLRTTDPRASAMAPRDGFNPRNPDGLLVALAYLASALASQVRQGARHLGLLQAPPPQVTTQMPPQVREAQRLRTQTLLASSRGRDAVPGTPRTTTDDARES